MALEIAFSSSVYSAKSMNEFEKYFISIKWQVAEEPPTRVHLNRYPKQVTTTLQKHQTQKRRGHRDRHTAVLIRS